MGGVVGDEFCGGKGGAVDWAGMRREDVVGQRWEFAGGGAGHGE